MYVFLCISRGSDSPSHFHSFSCGVAHLRRQRGEPGSNLHQQYQQDPAGLCSWIPQQEKSEPYRWSLLMFPKYSIIQNFFSHNQFFSHIDCSSVKILWVYSNWSCILYVCGLIKYQKTFKGSRIWLGIQGSLCRQQCFLYILWLSKPRFIL